MSADLQPTPDDAKPDWTPLLTARQNALAWNQKARHLADHRLVTKAQLNVHYPPPMPRGTEPEHSAVAFEAVIADIKDPDDLTRLLVNLEAHALAARAAFFATLNKQDAIE